jgi:hypothetical protein
MRLIPDSGFRPNPNHYKPLFVEKQGLKWPCFFPMLVILPAMEEEIQNKIRKEVVAHA